MIEKSGVSLNPTKFDRVTGSLRPLRDQIVVKLEPVKLSKILIAERKGTFRGTVIAVGPGCYPKKYSPDRSKTWDSKTFLPTELKVGDTVELGGQEHDGGYAFPRIILNGEEVVICTEKDVAGVRI